MDRLHPRRREWINLQAGVAFPARGRRGRPLHRRRRCKSKVYAASSKGLGWLTASSKAWLDYGLKVNGCFAFDEQCFVPWSFAAFVCGPALAAR